jgi:hypothetical protein
MRIYGYETKHYPNIDSGDYSFEEYKTMVIEVDGKLQYLDKDLKVMRAEKVQMVWWTDQRKFDYASEESIVYAIEAELKERYTPFKCRIDMGTIDLLEIHSR